MDTKTYSTDIRCPKCGAELYEKLYERVSSEGGRDFEWECHCGALLEIEVEAIPSFSIRAKNPANVLLDEK